MSHKIMAHLVAYFPDRESSLDIARVLSEGGARFLELQFPFSDPTADGPLIQEACTIALRQGFTVKGGFALASEICSVTGLPVFIMGYANTVFFRGIERFLVEAREAGVQGLIIPDLPPGCDEGLYTLGAEAGLCVVPVICPTIGENRLKTVLSLKPEYLYATLRKGITGDYTEIGMHNITFLKKIVSSGSKVLAGFGISSKKQIEQLAPLVHAAVVGSAFVKEILASKDGELLETLQSKIMSLV
jgi:tryptophan synthase alpha chain